jgi:hypothetical protein
MITIIGEEGARFAPLADLHHRALDKFELQPIPIGVHSPGHIGDTDEEARVQLWGPLKRMRDRTGAERGSGPMGPDEFEQLAVPKGHNATSPDPVASKIAATAPMLRLSRFDMKYSAGQLLHELLHCMELYGTEAIPRVRKLLVQV